MCIHVFCTLYVGLLYSSLCPWYVIIMPMYSAYPCFSFKNLGKKVHIIRGKYRLLQNFLLWFPHLNILYFIFIAVKCLEWLSRKRGKFRPVSVWYKAFVLLFCVWQHANHFGKPLSLVARTLVQCFGGEGEHMAFLRSTTHPQCSSDLLTPRKHLWPDL